MKIINTALFFTLTSLIFAQETSEIDINKRASDQNSAALLTQIKTELAGFLQDDYSSDHERKFLAFIENLALSYPNFKQAIDNGTTPPTAPQTGTIGSPDPILERAWLDSKSPYLNEGFKNYTEKSLDVLNAQFTPEFSALSKILTDIRNNIYNLSQKDLEDLQNLPDLNLIITRLKNYQNALNDVIPKIQAAYAKNTMPASAPQTILGGQTATQMNATENLMLYANLQKEFIEKLKTEINRKINELQHSVQGLKKRINRAQNIKT